MKLQIVGATQMEQFGGRFAIHCNPPVMIALQGELGSGKTTFVRGFLHGLGHTGLVKSPTYTLVEPYRVGDINIYHFDLYRVSDPAEIEAIGFRDYLEGDCICLIEWPEKGEGVLPVADIFIRIDYSDSARILNIEAFTESGQIVLDQVQTH